MSAAGGSVERDRRYAARFGEALRTEGALTVPALRSMMREYLKVELDRDKALTRAELARVLDDLFWPLADAAPASAASVLSPAAVALVADALTAVSAGAPVPWAVRRLESYSRRP